MSADANLDPDELAKFDREDLDWWDPKGAMRALHAINPARLQYVREFCTLRNAKVADVGCGGGLMTEALARCGAAATGIDLSATALAQARAHAQAHALDIDYRHQDAQALATQQAGRFDVVTCMELLEHVPDIASLLADCARLLRPNGALFVSTLNRTASAFALAILGAEHLLNLLPIGTHRYDRFIRPSELAQAARSVGLLTKDVRGIIWNPLARAARLGGAPYANYLMHLRPA